MGRVIPELTRWRAGTEQPATTIALARPVTTYSRTGQGSDQLEVAVDEPKVGENTAEGPAIGGKLGIDRWRKQKGHDRSAEQRGEEERNHGATPNQPPREADQLPVSCQF